MAFAAATMSMLAEILFNCSASSKDLPSIATLLTQTLAFLSGLLEHKDVRILETLLRHLKDLFAPLDTTKKLSQLCQDLETSSNLGTLPIATSPTVFGQIIYWQPLLEL